MKQNIKKKIESEIKIHSTYSTFMYITCGVLFICLLYTASKDIRDGFFGFLSLLIFSLCLAEISVTNKKLLQLKLDIQRKRK